KHKAPIYAFYNAEPDIEFDDDGTAQYIIFSCSACCTHVKQGLKSSDKALTGALIRHAKSCWGEEAVNAAQQSKSLENARAAIKRIGKKSQSKLAAALRTMKGWAESFSTQPPTKKEIRVVTARWVSESACPFNIVKDRCYHWLQREGRPERYIPSRETVSRDVKKLYTCTKEKLAKELQAQDKEIPIVIDCWTSPNH
ncbi:hypothetical protein BDP27DRAFT_1155391, partial [Rhodocollybia butyracea]